MKCELTMKAKSISLKLAVTSIVLALLPACTPSGEGANPGLVENPLVYAKRTIPVDDNGVPEQYDVREPLLFSPGGDLYIRTTTSSSVAEKNITRSVTLGTGDVKDLSANSDGKKVVFSLRLADPDPNNPTETWDIYEYDIENDLLSRVIPFNDTADDGNDIAPAYLPDGRIVFSSDRQLGVRAALSTQSAIGFNKTAYSAVVESTGNEVKALVLHVMDDDGDNIHQITYNQSHDLDPVVMPNGRILFSHWEHAGNNDLIDLYTVNPDGTDLQLYYGDHASSHSAGNDRLQFTKPRVMQDGRILVLARSYTNTYAGGDLLLLDGANYIDITRPTFANQSILSGPGQVKATQTNVSNRPVTDAGTSTSGRYGSAFPLLDGSNRLLVSKGICQLTTDDVNDPNIVVQLHPCIEPYLSNPLAMEMPSAYGLWLYNLGNNTERPLLVAEPGYILTDAIVVQPYSRPIIIADAVPIGVDAALAAENVGVLNIRSVYDMDGSFSCVLPTGNCPQTSPMALGDLTISADNRPARFLRILKPVGIPDRNDPELLNPPNLSNNAFGPRRNLGMREILGYTMIEPDGSVRVKVPANVAFGIEVLDNDGRRISRRHDNWLQVQAGETLKCNGCHQIPGGQNPPLPQPHGRRDAVAASVNTGMPAVSSGGYEIPNSEIPGISFPYLGNYQETMAEVRTRTDPSALTPSVDMIFEDKWRVTAQAEATVSYSYAGLTTAKPIPDSNACRTTGWEAGCRTVINYVDHVMPIWEAARASGACVSCHNPVFRAANVNNENQLDLNSDKDVDVPDHEVSYRELLFSNREQEVVNGALQFILVDDPNDPILDANGVTIGFNQIPRLIPPTMSADNGARGSYFFEKMTNTELNAARTLAGTTDHSSFLSREEMRLIAEWLDLGGQYFNNPFASGAP